MKNILKLSFLAAIVIGLASCLKDKGYDSGATGLNVGSQTQKLIGLALESGVANSASVALDFEDKVVTPVFVTVRLLSANPATEDIKVTLDTTNMNALFPAGIVRLPNSFFTIPDGLTVTIPKGAREATLKITTNAIQLDPSTTYGLGFRIKSVEPAGYTIASNFSTFFTTVGAKNKYDGVYQMTGYHNRPGFIFPYNQEMEMITTGGATVRFYWPLAGSFGHPIQTPTGVSWYGPTIGPEVTFNPVTNDVISVINAGGATPITLFTGPNSFPSRYEPATKTIYVCWNYNNNPDRAFFDTLVFKRPR